MARLTLEHRLLVDLCDGCAVLVRPDYEPQLLAHAPRLVLVVAPKHLRQRRERERAVLAEERPPERLDGAPPHLGEVRAQDARKEVGRAVVRDELEEAREGPRGGALAAWEARALCEAVQRECALQEWVGEECAREELGRPDDVGVAEVRQEVVGAELGLVGGRDGRARRARVVVELVERLEDCWRESEEVSDAQCTRESAAAAPLRNCSSSWLSLKPLCSRSVPTARMWYLAMRSLHSMALRPRTFWTVKS